MTFDGLMLAIFYVLASLTVKVSPHLHISFSGIAVIITCVLYGKKDGIFVAVLGSFLGQLTGEYGLTITTPIWMIPPILRAVSFGIIYDAYLSHGVKLEEKKVLFIVYVIATGLLTTAANTGAMILDAIILEYSQTLALLTIVFRLVNSILSSVFIGFVTLPILYALKQANLIPNRMKEWKTMRNTVLAYIENDGSYLMLYRNRREKDVNKGKWIGVGGHVDKGESIKHALKREIKEETNLDILKYKKCGIVYFHDDDYHEAMHLFLVTKYKGELGECDEGDLKFIKKEEVFNLPIWEGDKIFLKYLLTNEPYFELKLFYEGDTLVDHQRVL